ncbi:MAG: MarR family transcriptional regulator [Carnobacterium jeotgali]|uniref:MarR family winged helix-turn-helix transcriptional regulator n=1 Tax=Carnobacterium jeotgali TaxID=545534 RepID=UPI0004934FBA|nr:MarR family transcriptional regulator [Carnobacterium jeotgali]
MDGNNFLLEEQLCFSTYTLSKQFTKLYRPVLEPYSLTYTQYVALLVLWEESDLSVQSLGTRLGLDSGTLTPMLKRMESNGFITRKRHPEDERKVIIATTQKADSLRDELLEKVSACLALLNMNEKDYFDLLTKIDDLSKTLGGILND